MTVHIKKKFLAFSLTSVELLQIQPKTSLSQALQDTLLPKLISLCNNENILSACPDFGVTVETGMTFANSHFTSVSDFMYAMTFTSLLFVFLLLKYLQMTVTHSEYSNAENNNENR